jgi:predicted transcriptional regulator
MTLAPAPLSRKDSGNPGSSLIHQFSSKASQGRGFPVSMRRRKLFVLVPWVHAAAGARNCSFRCESRTLPADRRSNILKGMEVHFPPDVQARLAERAAQQGRKLDETVQDVVAGYFEEEDRFVEAVKRGEAALEQGDFLTHEQVGDRLRRFLQP